MHFGKRISIFQSVFTIPRHIVILSCVSLPYDAKKQASPQVRLFIYLYSVSCPLSSSRRMAPTDGIECDTYRLD